LPPKKRTLLVVEDDPGLQAQLKWAFDGPEVIIASDRKSALAELGRRSPSVVTLDLGLPPDSDGTSEGFATLEQVLAQSPDTKVVVVTGNDDRANAVRAVGIGAYDFIQKPVDPEILNLIVDRAFHVAELERENRELQRRRAAQSPLDGIIAAAPPMLKACRLIEKVAPTSATVLLLGESGTGKELLARAVHDLSPRSGSNFVAINCAAIPENLLESELFGFEKGAFTGAAKQTKGKIEFADGGTLFLDEIGDLPLALQSKLLRFLQERVIERVGGRAEIPIDLRVVCATHQDLDELIREGRFRQDLFYRVSEITVRIPPLRERDGDVVILARAFLEAMAKTEGGRNQGFSPDALKAIERYHWPGNVRELENRVRRAAIMAEAAQITAADLELEGIDESAPASFDLREAREDAERRALVRALSHVQGNVSQAAELLGVTRPTLYALMNKFHLRD
jgi:two-component system NtrC family response regulator